VAVRVIAGALKGRRLKTPTWDGLRPTSDKLRETLFNIVAARVTDARVLDGYAGTGAVGIEALSRGARWVAFVDDDRRAAALITENVASCRLEKRCAIIRGTVARALETLASSSASEPFDLVLLDPPYAPERRDDFEAILRAVGEILAQHGVVVLEHARRVQPPDGSGPLVRTRTVVSGDSALSWYECGVNAEGACRR
jgi:16S rRNA (guanine(966)-N(2))-methyltransferase RsmD